VTHPAAIRGSWGKYKLAHLSGVQGTEIWARENTNLHSGPPAFLESLMLPGTICQPVLSSSDHRFKVNVIGFARVIPAVAEYAPMAHTVPLAVVALNSSAAWPGSGVDTELHFVPSQCSVIG